MSQSQDYSNELSIKLSEVMEDIGVNEDIIMKRKHLQMLKENIVNVTHMSAGEKETLYYLGSQSEGTTTIGIHSDHDILIVHHDVNVMQDWSEWKQNMNNYLMIQDENVTPGYCFLQLVRNDVALPDTHIPNDNHIRDSIGRILLKNTWLTGLDEDAERQGPSNTVSGIDGYPDIDIVHAFPCVSLPQSASNFLERQGILRRLPSEITRYTASNGCFLVGTSSKISTFPELEWRISTSLAERCLMFNLNITQIQCYVLMKIVLKTFLNPRKENGLSSFMCKTVLLHCISNTEQTMWMKNNLFTCLTYCLIELRSCVESNLCSHFMIPENNLMAGQFTDEVKCGLLRTINDIIQSDGRFLFRINIDYIGKRLQVKLSTTSIRDNFPTLNKIKEECLSCIYIDLAQCILDTFWNQPIYLKFTNIRTLVKLIRNLTNFIVSGSRYEQLAPRYIKPLFCSILGSTLAARCIRRNGEVSSKALMWLQLGLDPDLTSGRLKLASVFYCTGEVERAVLILRQTEMDYDSENVVPICRCLLHLVPRKTVNFKRKCHQQKEDHVVRHTTSFCVIFLPIESNCTPRELRYEMTRSIKDDIEYRCKDERRWMDCAVVDSLPYLYFLQYKTYDYLQKDQDKQHALNKLIKCSVIDPGFGHRETTLNLLGQCMEQENRPREALNYYMLSLQQRARNNAAKIHICCLIAESVRNIKDF